MESVATLSLPSSRNPMAICRHCIRIRSRNSNICSISLTLKTIRVMFLYFQYIKHEKIHSVASIAHHLMLQSYKLRLFRIKMINDWERSATINPLSLMWRALRVYIRTWTRLGMSPQPRKWVIRYYHRLHESDVLRPSRQIPFWTDGRSGKKRLENGAI